MLALVLALLWQLFPAPGPYAPVAVESGGGLEGLFVATDGNDSTGDGTEGNPWATVQKAVLAAQPGDTIYLRAGTYSKLVCIGVNGGTGCDGTAAVDGTSTDVITITAYPGETAIITPDTSGLWPAENRNRYVMMKLARSYWRITGLRFEHNESPSGSFWWFYGIELTGPTTGIRIDNNVFDGNDVVRTGGTVIAVKDRVDDVVFEDNVLEFWPSESDVMGVTLESLWQNVDSEAEAIASENANWVITGNTFRGFGGDGVQIAPWGGRDTLIEDNDFIAIYNDETNDTEENAVDIKISWGTIVRGNRMSGYRPKGSNPDGSPIICHLMCQDVVIENNVMWDSSVGIVIANGNPASALPTPEWYEGQLYVSDVTVRRNLVVDMNTTASAATSTTGRGYGMRISGPQNVTVVHNTFAFNAVHAIYTENLGSGVVVTNNIIYGSNDFRYDGFKDDSSHTFNGNLTMGPNLFFNADPVTTFRWIYWKSGVISPTAVLATFVADSGATGSLQGNPLFVSATTDPQTWDYTLQSGSPAIGAGATVAGETYTGDPDIGAYEYIP